MLVTTFCVLILCKNIDTRKYFVVEANDIIRWIISVLGIIPEADLGTGDRACYLGVAESTSVLKVAINNGTSTRA